MKLKKHFMFYVGRLITLSPAIALLIFITVELAKSGVLIVVLLTIAMIALIFGLIICGELISNHYMHKNK